MLSALRRSVGVMINLTLVTGAIAMPVSRCKLLYPDSGSVTLRIKNRGNCVSCSRPDGKFQVNGNLLRHFAHTSVVKSQDSRWVGFLRGVSPSFFCPVPLRPDRNP